MRTRTIQLRLAGAFLAAGSVCSACALGGSTDEVPSYAHVVVVVEENHAYSQVADEPYIAQLRAMGTTLTDYHAIGHPSEPNYIALLAGSTLGIVDDDVHEVTAPNLATSLLASGRTFFGYCESLPSVGFSGTSSGEYVRRHAPWVSFTNIPSTVNVPFSDFPRQFAELPTVSFVIPNLLDDMHDGTVAAGDAWLQTNLGSYVSWARSHDSLFILTFDEDDHATDTNLVLTVFVGAGVPAGADFAAYADHYALLRTIEVMYGIAPFATDGSRRPLGGIWSGR